MMFTQAEIEAKAKNWSQYDHVAFGFSDVDPLFLTRMTEFFDMDVNGGRHEVHFKPIELKEGVDEWLTTMLTQ